MNANMTRTLRSHAPRLTALSAALAMCLLIALAGVAGLASASKPRARHKAKLSLLFVVNGAVGTLTPQPGHPGSYTLEVTSLEPHAVWFSDRPARLSGAFPSSAVARVWKRMGFAADPPNAALDYTDPALRSPRSVILELTHPHYDKRRRTLSFTTRIIDPTTVSSGNLASHARRADRTPAARFTDPSVFIDDEVLVPTGALQWTYPPAFHPGCWRNAWGQLRCFS
jgi:hypothetical protein